MVFLIFTLYIFSLKSLASYTSLKQKTYKKQFKNSIPVAPQARPKLKCLAGHCHAVRKNAIKLPQLPRASRAGGKLRDWDIAKIPGFKSKSSPLITTFASEEKLVFLVPCYRVAQRFQHTRGDSATLTTGE